MPAGHGSHADFSVSPSSGLNVPAGHAKQALAPVALPNMPAGHDRQDGCPADAAKVPSGQVVHEAAPAGADLPARQGLHAADELAPSSLCAVPAGHGEQVLLLVAAHRADQVPGPHSVHCALAEPGIRSHHVPGGQGEHTPAEGSPACSEPGGHWLHWPGAVAPSTAENVPFTHGWQVASDAAPVALDHVPAGQRSQA